MEGYLKETTGGSFINYHFLIFFDIFYYFLFSFRHSGEVFCGKCCAKKMALPQLGYENPERVCEGCSEIAYLVSYAISGVLSTQIIGARGLSTLSDKGSPLSLFRRSLLFLPSVNHFVFYARQQDGGIANLVNHGGLDALIYLCASPQQELNIITTSALETFSKIRMFMHLFPLF